MDTFVLGLVIGICLALFGLLVWAVMEAARDADRAMPPVEPPQWRRDTTVRRVHPPYDWQQNEEDAS